MAFDWNTTSSLYVFAAFLQFAFALLLIVKRPRSEWIWVLALLFAFNAGAAFGWALSAGLPESRWAALGTRAKGWFDPTTSFLILYLALVYPDRPAFFERRRWLLRLLVFAPWAALLYVYARPPDLAPVQRALYGWLFMDAVPVVGWIAVLWRWALLLPAERSPVRRRQFQFIFAAFGIRAAHMATFIPMDVLNGRRAGIQAREQGLLSLLNAEQWFYLVWFLLFLANIIVLLWAIVHLAQRRARLALDGRSAIEFVVLLLLVGIMEGFIGFTLRLLDWQFAFWLYFDVVAIRPALLWMGVLRYELEDPRLRSPAFALGLFSLLAIGVLFPGIRALGNQVLPDAVLLPDVIAVVLALTVSGGLAFALRPYFLRNPFRPVAQDATGAADTTRRDAVERYVASIEDAMKDGRLNARAEAQLLRLRGVLGISEEQHDALLWAVRSRWSEVPQTRDWIPGQTVGGRYRVEGIIAEGGTGTVYRAEDVVSGGTVVLKRTHRLDPDARRLLLREAYAASRLEHPTIVRFVATEDVRGEPVLVYDHLPGGTLKTRLAEKGRMTVREAVDAVAAVLSALEATHQAGIVHRDVKPSNILFAADGTVRLGDFGTAHVHRPPPAFGDPTRTGTQPGTLRYMSPEQARGLPTGPESDLYSVALVLYEAITGRPVVPDDLDDWEVRKMIIEGGLPALDALPAPLAPVVAHALTKDPQRRTASAAAFRAELIAAARKVSESGKRAPSGRRR